jgi:fructosamine-3-kinase
VTFEVEYLCGSVEIVKVCRMAEVLQNEVIALELMRASPCTLTVPEVFWQHYDNEINAFAMQKIDGVNANNLPFFLSRVKKKQIAELTVHALNQIHSVTQNQFGYVDKTERYDTWQQFYKVILSDVCKRGQSFFEQNPSKYGKKALKLLKNALKHFDYIFSEAVLQASLLHGDLWIANIMVDKKTYLPTGIIDPLHSMWGDREFDLFPLNAPWGKRLKLYKTYKAKYLTSKNVDLKCAVYYLANEVLCRLQAGSWDGGGGDKFYKMLTSQLEKQFKLHKI